MADKKTLAEQSSSGHRKGAAKKGIWNLYEKKGNDISCKNKSCPKCGQGHFMAKHTNRFVCGGCRYTEYVKSS